MVIHFHVGKIPVTFAISRGNPSRELAEKTSALLELAMMLPKEGARARYVLRRWAGGGK